MYHRACRKAYGRSRACLAAGRVAETSLPAEDRALHAYSKQTSITQGKGLNEIATQQMSRIGLSLIISKITPMHLNLGSIQLPLNAATKTFAILAKRGAGKSYTGAVLAEEFHKNNIPFVVFDPIDVWWGLRLAKDGKSKGLPVVVFGLEHADIPLTRDMGKEIAHAIVQENVSCVIS